MFNSISTEVESICASDLASGLLKLLVLLEMLLEHTAVKQLQQLRRKMK